MTQVTTGFRAILSIPWIYDLFQRLMGVRRHRRWFISRFIDPYGVDTILDIGCGPTGILDDIVNVEYYGYDISYSYIKYARSRYGTKGHFFAKELTKPELVSLPKFDLVIMHGLLHHLTDIEAKELLHTVLQALSESGRVVTADGCLVEGQNPLARWLIKNDRGQNIKDEAGYRKLALKVFGNVESIVVHRKWVPYTLCYLQCSQ